MPRIVRIVPVVLFVLASQAVVSQEPPDSARAFSEAQRSVSLYTSALRARTEEVRREIQVLSELSDASEALLAEDRQIEFLETSLERVRGTLQSTALAGGRAPLQTRKRALKGVP